MTRNSSTVYRPLLAVVLLMFSTSSICAFASDHGHWVGTWASSPLHPNEPDEQKEELGQDGITIREVVRISLGGTRLRLRFSNLDGTGPLTIGSAAIAESLQGSMIAAGSSHLILFSGEPSVTIPPGALALSDAVEFRVAPLSNLAVSLYVSRSQGPVTYHQLASAFSFHAKGNLVSAADFDSPEIVTTWEYLNGIDVLADDKDAAIVTLGDSITDGAYSTVNANKRWPDELARRLQADNKYKRYSVLNEAISGNKILLDRAGPNALARFDRDVLAQSGVRYLIILEGINDIGHTQTGPEDHTTAADLISALNQMIWRAHTHGIAVIGGTLTPYQGFTRYYSDKGEAIRVAVNQWIRTSGAFDGVIDFDAAVSDPSNSRMFLPRYDHGDHLHPNDTGYKAMGDAVSLKLFDLKPRTP